MIHPGFVGIDISKLHLDVFDGSVGNRREAIEPLIARWAQAGAFVLFEATGPYDRSLRQALAAAGLRFARVNPARARDFARACGALAKTDAIDARMLAAMAQSQAQRLLRSIPGVGPVAATTLIALIPELGVRRGSDRSIGGSMRRLAPKPGSGRRSTAAAMISGATKASESSCRTRPRQSRHGEKIASGAQNEWPAASSPSGMRLAPRPGYSGRTPKAFLLCPGLKFEPPATVDRRPARLRVEATMASTWPSASRRSWMLGGATLGAAAFFARDLAFAKGGTLTVAIQGLPDSLDTGISSFAALCLAYQTMDPLVLRNDSGENLPGLAEKWTAIDAATWKFDLRKNVKFHDGAPFTAGDVKFTLDYILDPKSVYGTKQRISQIAGAEIVDDHTILIKTKGPFPTLINGLGDIAIEPKHYVEKVGRQGMIAKPMGTGPFQFVSWIPGERYELKAFKDYWAGAPVADALVLRQIPEGSTRVAALLSGEAQVAEELPIDLIPPIEQSSVAQVDSVESTVGLLLTFDVRKPPFNDKRVRLALNHAIDAQKILDKILLGQGSLLQGQMLTSNTFGYNPNIKAFPYDPKKAKALLAEAGYEKGFETSITTRSGKYLGDVDICNVCAAMLADIGVKATVNVVEQGVFSKMTAAKDMGPMHMVGWYSLGDADFATVWFTNGSGRTVWVNPEFEKLFVEARTTVDQAARLKAYHRMMEIMHDEAPSIYLFGLPSVYGRSKKLKGWSAPSDKILRMAKATI